jgi:membrane associated rhomboid family serine protease
VIPLFDLNPTRRRPWLVIALILINFAVLVIELQAPTQRLRAVDGTVYRVNGMTALTAEYGFVPCEADGRCKLGANVLQVGGEVPPIRVHNVPVWATVFTSMFMHGGWLHLLGNMLFLWVFGNNVEDRLGRVRFLIFYLLSGVIAAGLQLLSDPSSAVPTIGASGAIAGVLGGYLRLFPRAMVMTLIGWFPVPLPAIIVLIGWFLLQLASVAAGFGTVGNESGGVAYFAHIGGFAFGLLTIRWWLPRRPPRVSWR